MNWKQALWIVFLLFIGLSILGMIFGLEGLILLGTGIGIIAGIIGICAVIGGAAFGVVWVYEKLGE